MRVLSTLIIWSTFYTFAASTATKSPPKPSTTSRSLLEEKSSNGNDVNRDIMAEEDGVSDQIMIGEESVENTGPETEGLSPLTANISAPSKSGKNSRFGFFNKRKADTDKVNIDKNTKQDGEEDSAQTEESSESPPLSENDAEQNVYIASTNTITSEDTSASQSLEEQPDVNKFGFFTFNRKNNYFNRRQNIKGDSNEEQSAAKQSDEGLQQEEEVKVLSDENIIEEKPENRTATPTKNTDTSPLERAMIELLEEFEKDTKAGNVTEQNDEESSKEEEKEQSSMKQNNKRSRKSFPFLKKKEKEASKGSKEMKSSRGGEESFEEYENEARTNTTTVSTDSVGNSDNKEETEQQGSILPSTPGPLGSSTPPFIILNPPLHGSSRSSPALPMHLRKTPQNPTDATITSLVNLLLPLLSRLLLLTLLSGSSALFGSGETIYSPEPSQHFMLERVNKRYQKDRLAMKKALEDPPENISKRTWSFALQKRRSAFRKQLKQELEKEKENAPPISGKSSPNFSRTVIIMDVQTIDADMDSVVETLRDSVSFILSQFNDKKTRLDLGEHLEVVVCIESPGGSVQEFGLAADQLNRLKEAGLERNDLILSVCVDKIAASGGYMMACQANPGHLFAAPFSVLGSIGVLRETINIHDVLEKYGVRPLLLKAGKSKVPLTQTNKVTEENIAIVQKNLDSVHKAFREMVSEARGDSITEFEMVTNGDIFLGKDAAKYGLIDRIMTSDEYIAEKIEAGDRVLRLHKYDRSRVGLKLSPLDLLLLRGNGLLGKNLSFLLKNSIATFSMRLGVTLGTLKVLEHSLQAMTYFPQLLAR